MRLEDLGQVIDSVENDKIATWYNGDRAPSSSPSSASPGTNTVEVVDAIKTLLPDFRRRCRPR